MAALKRMAVSGRPTPQECRAVIEALSALHGRPNRHQHSAGLQVGCELKEPHTVLDSLVRTILSQNTTDITSQRAYTSLKQAFPDWERVRTAPPGAVEDAIRVGGLADIKAGRIKAILESLLSERGELSLEHLRQLPSDVIKAQLLRYKGVGPKSIACVMLFCLGRDECPVDTHVWEISKQFGWVAETASREATYEYLNAVVPDEHKYELHVLLVEHGKVCPECFKRSSKSGAKRGGKGAAAAAAGAVVACPLRPFKKRSSGKNSSPSSSKAAAGLEASSCGSIAVKAEPGTEAAAAVVKLEEAAEGLSQGTAAAAVAAAAEAYPVDAAVKVKAEQLQNYACKLAAAVKQEPGEAQPGPQQLLAFAAGHAASEMAETAPQQPARLRKRTRRA